MPSGQEGIKEGRIALKELKYHERDERCLHGPENVKFRRRLLASESKNANFHSWSRSKDQ